MSEQTVGEINVMLRDFIERNIHYEREQITMTLCIGGVGEIQVLPHDASDAVETGDGTYKFNIHGGKRLVGVGAHPSASQGEKVYYIGPEKEGEQYPERIEFEEDPVSVPKTVYQVRSPSTTEPVYVEATSGKVAEKFGPIDEEFAHAKIVDLNDPNILWNEYGLIFHRDREEPVRRKVIKV